MKLYSFTVLLLLGVMGPSTAFLPNKYLAWIIRGLRLSLASVDTHKDMTKSAILEVAANVMQDNSNPKVDDSSARITALSSFSVNNLITAYYGRKDRGRIKMFQNAIAVVSKANADVDLKKSSRVDAASHFDSEQFDAGQIRLIEKRRSIVDLILRSDYQHARMECGRMFHTLQDFYSHTNWVENGNEDIYRVLGRNDARVRNTVGNRQTCTNCGRGSEVNLFNYIRIFFAPYLCEDNLHRDLKDNNWLTSGYYSGQLDNNGQRINKPEGKCSHGGFRDASSGHPATGGINKDCPYNIWSPHYKNYAEAARLAKKASIDILNKIRREVNRDSLFSKFLGFALGGDPLESVSIAYVIDTTESMAEELPEIQATIPEIRKDLEEYANNSGDNTLVRYILVPFNDPDPGVTFETYDIEEFLSRIREINPTGGGAEPDPSIGAAIRAIEASDFGSPVFVFTDATASDEDRRIEAETLISRKNTPVTFVISNLSLRKRRSIRTDEEKNTDLVNSRTKRQTENSAYEQLAAFSGGQVLNILTTDISEMSDLVSYSAVQSRRTIFRISGLNSGTHLIPIDSSVFQTTISVSGEQIGVSVVTPQGNNASNIAEYIPSLISPTSYIAQVIVTSDVLRGNWSINIQSQGLYNIQVIGSSDIVITENLYKIDDSSEFGFSQFDGRPIQGEPAAALVSIESSNSVPIIVNSINVIGADGMVFQSLNNLKYLAAGLYAATFVPPSEAFLLQIIGVDQSGYSMSHFTDLLVQTSSIFLTLVGGGLQSLTMRPGEETRSNLRLHNLGESTKFVLSVKVTYSLSNRATMNTDFFKYSLNLSTLFLAQNTSGDILLTITTSENASNGLAVTFTVIAQSTANEDIDNFISIDVITTTRPATVFSDFNNEETEVTICGVKPTESMLLMEMLVIFASLMYINCSLE